MRFYAFSVSLISISLLAATAGCNGNGSVGQAQGQDETVHAPVAIPTSNNTNMNPTPIPSSTPSSTPTPSPVPSPSPTNTGAPVGSTCHSTDITRYCVGLKYVVYQDSVGKAVVSEGDAASNIAAMNTVWAQCKIAFEMDEYLAEDPTRYALTFNTANSSELDKIRSTFDDSNHLLVVTTGKWNRAGTLGSTGANAWTNMPGDTILGAVLESSVGTYPNIIAHELGHYMNLPHVSNTANLMNPIIYDTSTQLTTSQCNGARAALSSYWKAMLR